MSQYILPHDLTGEKQRLRLMSELLDPLDRCIERLGLQAGWRCLEVGCGNGSISEWLASRVGPSGHVVASDIDLRYIAGLAATNLEVRQLNIVEDAVEQGAYDLVTARAVLHHVRRLALGRVLVKDVTRIAAKTDTVGAYHREIDLGVRKPLFGSALLDQRDHVHCCLRTQNHGERCEGKYSLSINSEYHSLSKR
jgi:SAM-dependent methyltransferase